MLNLCETVGVASCSSHLLCSYNLMLGFISSVYPDSVNVQRHSADCSSSYSILLRHLFTNFGMVLDNRSLHPHTMGGGAAYAVQNKDSMLQSVRLVDLM
jgi:hypothetical protein